MHWQQEYEKKKATPAQAVGAIRSGHRVVIGHAVGEPYVLTEAMVANREAYRDVEIVHMVAMGEALYCGPGMEKHFWHNSLFLSGATREAVNAGRGDFTPCYFSEFPALLRTTLKPDAALFQVSPPDAHGYCSYGIAVDYTKPAVECASIRIAQVNRHMPRTLGDSFIHVSDIDYIVEADTPLLELLPAEIGERERRIGAHCAALVRDGDTLQLGIGAIPDAVLHALGGKNDLGIHSEMISDGVMALMREGIITNRAKTLLPGKSVVTFIMGSKKLYEFVHDNPAVEMHPVGFVNDPAMIARNDNMVAINSCVQVDLMGQVASCSAGRRQISGVGGQVDFVRGANLSRGGRSIMAMPSIAKNGASKIVPVLDEGTAVTTNRYDVGDIVTEYGVARLKGKTLRQRARALIAIAHPDYRAALAQEYERRFSEKYAEGSE